MVQKLVKGKIGWTGGYVLATLCSVHFLVPAEAIHYFQPPLNSAPPPPLRLADQSVGLIRSKVQPIPLNRMGQMHGTHLFSAECNTWQLGSLK